jgi:hypothetical protein
MNPEKVWNGRSSQIMSMKCLETASGLDEVANEARLVDPQVEWVYSLVAPKTWVIALPKEQNDRHALDLLL